MSNENILAPVAEFSFKRADEIVANSFDYGNADRKRIAIAMNMLALASSDGPTGLKYLWKNNMIDAANKTDIIRKLKNMRTEDADDAIADIWDYMEAEDKQLHLNNHPKSYFHVLNDHIKDVHDHHADQDVKTEIKHQEEYEELKERHKRRIRNKARAENRKGEETIAANADWWEEMTIGEQRQYLRDHPGSKKARRLRVAARGLAMKVVGPIHHEVRKMGHDYRNGMEGLRRFRSGRKMTDEQKEGLQKTAKRVAVILVSALAVSAMYSALMPFAADVGAEYNSQLEKRQEELAREHEREQERQRPTENPPAAPPSGGPAPGDTTVGEVTSGSNLHGSLKKKTRELHKNDEMELEWMRRDMTEWLLKTDVQELVEKMKDNQRGE